MFDERKRFVNRNLPALKHAYLHLHLLLPDVACQ